MHARGKLRRAFHSGHSVNSDRLVETLSGFEYISFDIFDTLVKRNVSEPEDVFRIIESLTGDGFAGKRLEAEKQARSRLGKTEITLADIYSFFPAAEREELMQLEINIEKDLIVPNLPLKQVFERCIQGGKTVVISSDMYWDLDQIQDLLVSNGYSGFTSIYLSSDLQMLKSDGSLFREILRDLSISPSQLVHIGDSFRGDYLMPKRLGIEARRVPRYVSYAPLRSRKPNESIQFNYLNCFTNNTIPTIDDPYYRFGYARFGRLLYGFANWVYEEAKKRGVKRIFFFSRDGFIMKAAYEACINDASIETEYLEVSRRSLRVPILWVNCTHDSILNMVVNSKAVSLVSLLDGLGLCAEDYSSVISSFNLSIDEEFDRSSIAEDKRLRRFLDAIRPDIVRNSREEYSELSKYIREHDIHGRFAVVDIGYGGSMQRYLQQALTQMGIEHDITGFYFGVAEFYRKNCLPGSNLDLNGYIFDFCHDQSAVDTRSSFVGLFETLFLEQAGSVKCYSDNGTTVIAKRYSYEYLSDGNPTPDLLHVQSLQRGAMDFINAASRDRFISALRCNPNEYYAEICKTGQSPTFQDLSLFGDMAFFDEGEMTRLAAPKSIFFYMLHPKTLKSDFLRCRWKTGFMKRLLFLRLPYQNMYNMLLKLKKE